jgi:hypothetical protein
MQKVGEDLNEPSQLSKDILPSWSVAIRIIQK